MSRKRNRRPISRASSGEVLPALTKASLPGGKALPPGTVTMDATDLVRALSTVQRGGLGFTPMPRDPSWGIAPFGPNQPLIPASINAPRVDSGRPEPRRFDYPTSWNLPGTNHRLVPWKVLRDVADTISMVRRAIEVRKGNAIGLEWDFAPSKRAVQELRRSDTSLSDSDALSALRDKTAEPIARLRDFWTTPDRGNGWSWEEWLGAVIEEHLVLDALALYPRTTLGGDLFSIEVIDGSTIKPLLDARGNRPLPPFPAYQQMLHGFPRGEFTATIDSENDEVVGFASDTLLYQPRTRRSWTPYGHSAVEQCLIDADTWFRRQGWMRAEYTDGTLPTAWLMADVDLNPDQVREYERVVNAELAGSTAERHRYRLLPKGFTTEQQKDAAERYKPDYDEFLVRVVCSHFDVLPTEIAVSQTKSSLGGKGHQEGEADSMQRRQRPLLAWVSNLVTQISRTYLDCPTEVVHTFLGLESEDEDQADIVADRRMKRGVLTVNDDRDRIGLPRLDIPEADMPFLIAQGVPTFLDGASEPPPPPVIVAPGGAPGAPPGAKATVPAKAPVKPAARKPAATVTKADEVRQFLAYSKRDRSRPFAFTTLDGDEQTTLLTAADAGPEAVRAAAAIITKAATPSARDNAPATP